MEIVFAGFGGQGVLTAGLILSYIAMKNDYKTLWSPAYGGAMRGGKAYSLVKYDKQKALVPTISKSDAIICMNQPSLDFAVSLKETGTLLVNSDLIGEDIPIACKGKIVRIPFTSLAIEATGKPQAANVAAAAAAVRALGDFSYESALENMKLFFEEKGKGKFNAGNEAAFKAGYEYF